MNKISCAKKMKEPRLGFGKFVTMFFFWHFSFLFESKSLNVQSEHIQTEIAINLKNVQSWSLLPLLGGLIYEISQNLRFSRKSWPSQFVNFVLSAGIIVLKLNSWSPIVKFAIYFEFFQGYVVCENAHLVSHSSSGRNEHRLATVKRTHITI